jgi:hypothetical protein
MKTPPTRHEPRQTPLDSEERALSEALKRVPASDPGAELDARVLGMARAALHPKADAPVRRHRLQRLSWLGSAAGAVLAVGIGWQLSRTEPELGPGLPSASTAAPQMQAPAESQSLEFEVIRRPAEPASPAPPVANSSAAAEALRESVGNARAAKAEGSAARPTEPRRRQSEARADGERAAPVPAPLAAPPPPQAHAEPEQPRTEAPAGSAELTGDDGAVTGETTLDRVEVTGSRVRGFDLLDADGFPPIVHDARLQPREWIERIRARRAAGQDENARKSLEDFARSYPYLVVPADLRPLLSAAQ